MHFIFIDVLFFFNNSDTLASVQRLIAWAKTQQIDWSGKCRRMQVAKPAHAYAHSKPKRQFYNAARGL